MKKAILAIVVIALVAGGVYFVMNMSKKNNPVTESSQTGISAVKEFTVTAKEFFLSPSAITAKKGEQIKITFKNNGTMPHNFTLNGLGINTNTIKPGETDAVQFTASSAGTYDFFCSVPGHREAGMFGTLKIE